MAGPRVLLTGRTGDDLRQRAIARSPADSRALWLVPSSLARTQLLGLLARKARGSDPPRVLDWPRVWDLVAEDHANPPARLSAAGVRAALVEAIERAGRSGGLEVLGPIVDLAGYRRQLLGRFAAWTLDERPAPGPPPGNSPVDAEEWGLFGHYRAVLSDLKAEDPEGFAVWASRALLQSPPPEFRHPGHVVAIDPIGPTKAVQRVLDSCRARARSILVTLPFDPDPALSELYATVEPVRARFLDQGYVEERVEAGGLAFRDHGFEAIERELFRTDAHLRTRLKLRDCKVLGGPRGEGVALLIAREVREALSEHHPDEILILVPRIDDDAELIRATLRNWGLPVAKGPGARLSTLPGVSALRLAIRLPVVQWDVATLVRLLRNGQVGWPGQAPMARFEAASAIRATRVFRDRSTLRRALEPGERDEKKDTRDRRAALGALDRLASLIDPVARPGTWQVQVDRLAGLADGLGLGPAGVGALLDALDDQGWVFDRLGPTVANVSWTWAAFVDEVEAIVGAAENSPAPPCPGTIRIEAVGDAWGARAEVMILANLAEKSFPTPDSIDLGASKDSGPTAAFSREMLRFIGVVGSADRRLILAYPTSDLDGSPLLPAGFLDDLLRRLDPATRTEIVEEHARFDPVLADHDGLARSRADERVLAVALACRNGSNAMLRTLAGRLDHAGPLLAAAETFRIARHRSESRIFGPYDGRLLDPAAVAKVRKDFGPGHPFSPSQLESFALCPFRFFQEYVLGLKPVDDLDELEEDYASRGQDIHRHLEEVHQQMATEKSPVLADRLPILIETRARVDLERFEGGDGNVAEVLREIEARRNAKSLAQYVAQFRAYSEGPGKGAIPDQFEVQFGQPDKEGSLPMLTIGEADAAVSLQGVIDRIDLVSRDGRVGFRVIDYKTGSHPGRGDVHSGLASQLPLYAMAVERLLSDEGEHHFDGAGYWSLRGDGYKGLKFDDWTAYRERLEGFILALVDKLREGNFPVFSQKKGCPSFCDFSSACRWKEVDRAGKDWADRPVLEGGS